MGDADDSYDFADLEPFVEQPARGLRPRRRQPLQGRDPARRDAVAAPAARQPGAVVHRPAGSTGRRCGDIYCGLRGFDREKVAALDIRSTGMEFAIEMIVKATMQGLRVTEVPTTLSPDAEGREPHLNTWTDGWKSVRLLLLYSPKWLFLYPGPLPPRGRDRRDGVAHPGESVDRRRRLRREHAPLLLARGDRRAAGRLLLPDRPLVRDHRGPAAGRPADPAASSSGLGASSGRSSSACCSSRPASASRSTRS